MSLYRDTALDTAYYKMLANQFGLATGIGAAQYGSSASYASSATPPPRPTPMTYVPEPPKGTEMPIAPEKRPQGWKAAMVVLLAGWLALKLWKNRDEIFVKAEEMFSQLGDKLGIGDISVTEEKK